jgi:hypothetical protein
VWDSGAKGAWYDDGVNPHITLNNRNEVVDVHQVTGEPFLHYRRGTLHGGTIAFARSVRYDSNSHEAAVALLDTGFILELHRNGRLYARSGMIDFSNMETIHWSDQVQISDDRSNSAKYPSVATNGRYAIATWESYSFDITGQLFYSVTAVP